MLNWFNNLDSVRRLFVLAVIFFYIAFLYMNFSNIVLMFEWIIFNREALKFQMEYARLTEGMNSNLGLSVSAAPFTRVMTSFKILGISIVVVSALSYALFKKKE